jgi:hypothetical protein
MREMGIGWSFETGDAVWTYERAIMPFFWANYLPQKLGGQQLYLMNMRDAGGELMSGKNTYRLHVPSDVPVDKFWSVIVYSQMPSAGQDFFLILRFYGPRKSVYDKTWIAPDVERIVG